MDWYEEPTLRKFTDHLTAHAHEVGVMDNDDGYVGSHKVIGSIRICPIDPDDDADYEIVGLELDQLMGCGCFSGVVIKIKKKVIE